MGIIRNFSELNLGARSLDITPMDTSAYTVWMTAIGFDADKSYIGQKDARLKRIFRRDGKKAKGLSETLYKLKFPILLDLLIDNSSLIVID